MAMKDDGYDPLIALGNCLMLALLCLLALCSCRSKTQTVVETRTETQVQRVLETRIDTVLVAVPAESESVVTPDTCSYLSTSLAESWAIVNADGTLRHTLTQRGEVAAPVSHTTERVDSLVYVEKPVTVTVERQLSAWDKFRLGSFWYLVGTLAVSLIWIFRKKILCFIRFVCKS